MSADLVQATLIGAGAVLVLSPLFLRFDRRGTRELNRLHARKKRATKARVRKTRDAGLARRQVTPRNELPVIRFGAELAQTHEPDTEPALPDWLDPNWSPDLGIEAKDIVVDTPTGTPLEWVIAARGSIRLLEPTTLALPEPLTSPLQAAMARLQVEDARSEQQLVTQLAALAVKKRHRVSAQRWAREVASHSSNPRRLSVVA